MEKNDNESKEILLAVYESQRQESLTHRQSIFNTFQFSLLGLMAILAGIVAPGKLSCNLKIAITVSILLLTTASVFFIRRQRNESEKAMNLMRNIERKLGLYETGRYLEEELLPIDYQESHVGIWGLSRSDWLSVGSIVLIALSIVIVVIILPS